MVTSIVIVYELRILFMHNRDRTHRDVLNSDDTCLILYERNANFDWLIRLL